MANSFTYKILNENELFSFDYSQVLQPNEIIVSAIANVILMNGVDPNPSAILLGSPVISTPKVSQRIINGLNEVTYRLEMTATTDQGNVFTAVGDLTTYDASNV
jgi:hypothetical protein